MPPVAVILIALLLAAAALMAHAAWRRRQLLARLRSAWGKVAPAGVDLDERVSEAWQELRTSGANDAAIDERTWTDLDLDTVLAAIDRTHTALGRQVLYWRLRSGTSWRDTPDQEALTARFGNEPKFRETIGVQLAGAGRSLGYGLWVITRPELILVRWWYWSFPLLAIAMLASIAAIPFQPRALLAAVAIVVVNMLVRMATAATPAVVNRSCSHAQYSVASIATVTGPGNAANHPISVTSSAGSRRCSATITPASFIAHAVMYRLCRSKPTHVIGVS